ncbi:MAG: transpeptidase family protein [Deltaproteobacteria bacterium]|jgi:cell division protein FtsI (penicillin-binding protein 3)|nr:transpeptidase family protein [Deltaproteobacteria bacterium]
MAELSGTQRTRVGLLCLFFALLFALGIARAVDLQIVRRDELRALQREKTETVLTIPSLRGDIYDCHLEKLATSVVSDTLSVHGMSLKDGGEVFYQLSEALDMDYETLARRLEYANGYKVVKRYLTEEESSKVRSMGLDGVVLEQGYLRVYPNGPLAAHLLGFVGVDGMGLEGLELALNSSLSAKPRRVKVTRDKRGRVIMGNASQPIDGLRGASVILTLDKRIQFIAERAIAKAVVDTNAKSGMVIAVRPATGEIVASAVYPTFDPNNYGLAEASARRNMILTDPFEPGSTFKVITVAAALEEKIIAPDSVFFCENGFYKINGETIIRDTAAYGDLTVSQIVQKSSNIGASKIGERLGPRKLHNYLTRFSFGEKSGLAYPSGESAGLLRAAKDFHVVDTANISFGQGISVTALQLVMAVSALANEGVLMRPMLVSHVIDSEGNIIEQRERDFVRQVVSPLTAGQVLSMMRMAVMKGGTGTRADIPEYPIAGKTGTSQVYSVSSGTYSHDSYVASFIGVAPYEKPELCLLVVLDQPWPSYYGGVVAAPVFKEIMSQALPLLDVPPTDKVVLPKWPTPEKASHGAPGVLPDYGNLNFVRVVIPKNDKGSKGPIPRLGPGLPRAGAAIVPASASLGAGFEPKSSAPVAQNPFVMPDLSGLTVREAMAALSQHKMMGEYLGSGVAFSQEPKPGARVGPGDVARVEFRSRAQPREYQPLEARYMGFPLPGGPGPENRGDPGSPVAAAQDAAPSLPSKGPQGGGAPPGQAAGAR